MGRKHGKAWRRGGAEWGMLCGYGGNPMFNRVRLVGWVGTQLRMWPRKVDDCRDPRWHTRRISGSSRLNTSLAPSSVSSSARPNPRPNPRPDSALNPRPDPSHVYCPGVEMRSEREANGREKTTAMVHAMKRKGKGKRKKGWGIVQRFWQGTQGIESCV